MVCGLFGLGWYMTGLKAGSAAQFKNYQFHKSLDLALFGLTTARLVWRLFMRPPALPETMPRWERKAAGLSHIALYGMPHLIPLVGLLVVSASPWNIPTFLYGTIPVPHAPGLANLADRTYWESALKVSHRALGWILLALLAVHIGAVLRHHFIRRDGIVQRMLPFGLGATDD